MKKSASVTFSQERLAEELKTEARATGIPDGMAAPIAEKVAKKVAAWVAGRSAITSADLNRCIADEVRRFSADLAYVYENRGKII